MGWAEEKTPAFKNHFNLIHPIKKAFPCLLPSLAQHRNAALPYFDEMP
jgi:hypothetical protein